MSRKKIIPLVPMDVFLYLYKASPSPPSIEPYSLDFSNWIDACHSDLTMIGQTCLIKGREHIALHICIKCDGGFWGAIMNTKSMYYFLYFTLCFTNHNLSCVCLIFLIKQSKFKNETKKKTHMTSCNWYVEYKVEYKKWYKWFVLCYNCYLQI